jgi:putative copper resistance protein D
MAAFVDVVLRGLALSGQAVAIGGVVFVLLVWRAAPAAPRGPAPIPAVARSWRLVALGALSVAAVQCLSLGSLVTTLRTESGWPLADVLGTPYGRASIVRILASVGLAAGGLAAARRARVGRWWAVLLLSAVALAVSSAWTSHAAARLDHRGIPLALDALHQVAASVWIGGLFHLMMTVLRREPYEPGLLRRFSTLALSAVTALIVAGVGLTLTYVDGVRGLLGTAYGVMVLTKMLVLGVLLLLGAANFFAVRRLEKSAAPSTSRVRLRRFVEVEFGLAITVLFAAASLTSLPPAVDVVIDRATLAEVSGRFIPRWPTLTSPSISELPVDDPNAPRTDADRAWSEYNHHVSGLFVLTMGALAALHLASGARWARHWPLIFLGLAGFMLVRNDPGAWPLGPTGFWESMADPAVLQHRIFVLMVSVFGVFEWMVRTGRLRAPRYTLVFPLLCAAGGGLLLTHSHASLNLKAEFLVELTHVPLAVLGMLTGWARWLELRLAAPDDRVPAWLSSSALALVGVVLLLYRES